MSITVLSDVVMSERVMSAGVRGRQNRRNTRVTSQSGSMKANIDWQDTLREYEVGYVPMLPQAWNEIEGLFEVTDAGAYGFLMLDPKDSVVSSGDGLLQGWNGSVLLSTVGTGYGVPAYKLIKRIASTGTTRTKDRLITRPLSPIITRAGSPVAEGVGPGDVGIDTATGVVTFVADVSQAIASITVGASTVLTFANGTGAIAALSVGQRVYISGVAGTGASTLNALSHVITAKDAGLFTLTISTVTTGFTATGGTAAKYPQASEALAWTGRFYVPVHFMNDQLDWELVRSGPTETRLIAGPSVTLMEVRE